MQKQHLLSILIGIALCTSLMSQTTGFNYQAVIRNETTYQPIDDPSLSVRVRLLKDAANGTNVFEEIHSGKAAVNGRVMLTIGGVNSTVLDTIDWSIGTYFIEIDYDLNNGTVFSNTDAAQVLKVPMALWANSCNPSFNGSDLNLGLKDGRPIGTRPAQRALVHDINDVLIINYDGDFEGGVRVDSKIICKILEITGGDVAEARHTTTGEKLPVG